MNTECPNQLTQCGYENHGDNPAAQILERGLNQSEDKLVNVFKWCYREQGVYQGEEGQDNKGGDNVFKGVGHKGRNGFRHFNGPAAGGYVLIENHRDNGNDHGYKESLGSQPGHGEIAGFGVKGGDNKKGDEG